MNEDTKQKLAQLRQKYINSPESQADIDAMEARLDRLIDEAKLADHPVFKAITDDAQKRLEDLNILLMNDEKLTDLERTGLFAQKKVWHFIFQRFSLIPQTNNIKRIHADIQRFLEI